MENVNRISSVIAKLALTIGLAGGCIYLAARIGSLMAVQQVTTALRSRTEAAGPRPLVITSEVIEIDFYQATGIEPDELKAYVQAAPKLEGREAFDVAIMIQNDRGEVLHEGDIVVRWEGGEQLMHVGRSAVLDLPLRGGDAVRLAPCCSARVHENHANVDPDRRLLYAREKIKRLGSQLSDRLRPRN